VRELRAGVLALALMGFGWASLSGWPPAVAVTDAAVAVFVWGTGLFGEFVGGLVVAPIQERAGLPAPTG